MIWSDPRESLSADYYVHPLYEGPSCYRPAWHATQTDWGGEKTCPFPDCDWQTKFDPEEEYSERRAEDESERHYERQHAGRIRVQITLEREYQLGSRDPDDVRLSELERFEDKLGYDVAYVRSEVLEEADDHSVLDGPISRVTAQEDSHAE